MASKQQVIFSSLVVACQALQPPGSLQVIADVLLLHTHQEQVSEVKPKIHFIAYKKMKVLVHPAAMNAITFNEKLKVYDK